MKPLQGLFCPVMSRKNLTVEDQLLNLYIGKVPPIVFFAMGLFLIRTLKVVLNTEEMDGLRFNPAIESILRVNC